MHASSIDAMRKPCDAGWLWGLISRGPAEGLGLFMRRAMHRLGEREKALLSRMQRNSEFGAMHRTKRLALFKPLMNLA